MPQPRTKLSNGGVSDAPCTQPFHSTAPSISLGELKTETRAPAPSGSGPGPISVIWVSHGGTALCLSASVSPRSDCKEKFLVTEGKRQAAECEEVRVEDDLQLLGRCKSVGTEGRHVWQPTGVLSGRNGSPKYKLEDGNQLKSQSAMAGPEI